MGPRPRRVRSGSDEIVYLVRGKLLGIPKQMTITDAHGAEAASLKAKAFSPIKTRMTLHVPSGDAWNLEGSLIEKNYSITRAGEPIVQITQKWVTIKDTYTLDVADGIDLAWRWPSCGRLIGGWSETDHRGEERGIAFARRQVALDPMMADAAGTRALRRDAAAT